ncbi:hypothetical protein VP01_2752g5 [Puccinia sorghi]|uniref:Dynein light intermediate chain n=1 Tax=Puccinia sorghi TaxID=27349 RepID=A0A0L6V3P1_9BASI|nr:hypothetical protein VP01_2752g5 [Puccinia sorghi]
MNKTNYDQLHPGEGNLWSSILDSVSNNREKSNLPTKKLILLGERNSGKSTLATYLTNSTQPDNNPIPPTHQHHHEADMGTSYTTLEIGDDGDDGGNTNVHLDLPLPPGTLTENMGIGIVVVCTKSDEIDQLEKEKDFKEEQFDFIQQVLRSICLRFGGALFFTSQKKPETLVRLRSYVLHRLFGQLISTTTTAAGTTTGSGGTVTTNARLFPFPYKANVVDRDEVLIPMGWDSWGKIKILRDGFDPSVVGNGWLFDLEKPLRLRPDGNAEDMRDPNIDDDQVGYDSEGRKIVSACKLWEDMIGETDDEAPPINPHDRVVATQEQNFLKSKYEAIKKERDLDPRSHFQLNNKGHSAQQQQAIKFTNGTSMLSDTSSSTTALAGSDGLMTSAGVEEKMNAQLNKLSFRDQQGYHANGGAANAGLSPVEILHLQQQQAQLQQTPRMTTTTGGSSSTHKGAPPSLVNSPLASRSGLLSHHQQKQPRQEGMMMMGTGSTPASSSTLTPGGSQGEKAMLANFFGKLLDKDVGGARSLSTSSSSTHHHHLAASSALFKSSSSSSSTAAAAPPPPSFTSSLAARGRRGSHESLHDN